MNYTEVPELEQFIKEQTLKPCPFCGSDLWLSIENTHTPCYSVTCEDCEAEISGGYVSSQTEGVLDSEDIPGHKKAITYAVEKWNNRQA